METRAYRFGSEKKKKKMAKRFTRFTGKKQANYYLKHQKEQQEDNSKDDTAIGRIFAELNNRLSPKLPFKEGPIDMKLTLTQVSMFQLAFKLGIILNK